MTKERRDRMVEISKTIAGLRHELLTMRLDEIRELPSISEKAKYASSREHITEIKKATDLLADGLCELGYQSNQWPGSPGIL